MYACMFMLASDLHSFTRGLYWPGLWISDRHILLAGL